jgi:hypothetical protein
MIYKIYSQDAETLLENPETGMGYQIVNASQYNRTQIRKFVVYNTNLAVEIDSEFQINRRKIINEGYKSVLQSATELMLETDSIKVFEQSSVREFVAMSESKKTYNKRHSGGKGATDNPKEYANGNEYFVRISAYEDDKRIDFEKMRLKSGSFTTTLTDYNDCISTNDDPIDRYALPNDEKIKWSFYIKPKTIDTLQRGIVQPAFNHAGGGIEAYFEKGTSGGTYLFKRDYGK